MAICKNGIEFVDSPGLDDPTSHDNITKEYLPTADAIIYCMNSQAAYSAKDKAVIEALRSLGYTSIIFVLTYFDILQDNDEMLGSNDAEELKNYILKTLSSLTDLGENGIFFVNSLAAIKGKMKQDEYLIKKSNFHIVEKRMEEILVNERGRIKIIRSLFETKGINRKNGNYIADSITLANNKHLIITQQLNNAKQMLVQAKSKADIIHMQIEHGITDAAKIARDKGTLFLINELIPQIETWVKEFEPNKEISITDLKDSIRKYTEAIVDHMKTKLNISLSKWCKQTIVKECIEGQFSNLLLSQKNNLSSFQKDLTTVKINLKLPIDEELIVDKLSPSTTNRVITGESGIFTGDFLNTITNGIMGLKTTLSKRSVKITTGLVIGLVGILTPYSLSVLILGTLLGSFGVGFIEEISIKSLIKNKIITETKRLMAENKEKFSHEIYTEVKDILTQIEEKIKDELIGPIHEAQKLVNEANDNMNTDGVTMQQKIHKLTQLKSINNQITADLDKFAEMFTV